MPPRPPLGWRKSERISLISLDHNYVPPVISAGGLNPGPWMVGLNIGLAFAILALGPGILPGRRLNGIMIKAPLISMNRYKLRWYINPGIHID